MQVQWHVFTGVKYASDQWLPKGNPVRFEGDLCYFLGPAADFDVPDEAKTQQHYHMKILA